MDIFTRRPLRAALLVLSCIAAAAHAQSPPGHLPGGYPNRPIRFIVSFPPGGGADAFARILGQKLADVLGQQIVIDNRAGAGGNIAAEIAARAVPDGYTLLQSTVGHAINASLAGKPSYDLSRDFNAVVQLAAVPFLLVVNPSVQAATVKELVALAKARPGFLSYASSGSGGPSHLAMELFKSATQINAQHIPYKGAGPAAIDLVAGQVHMMFSAVSTVYPLIKTGRLRALGIGGLKRSVAAPEIPTVDEGGITGFEASTWYGVQVPAGTPRPIITALHAEITKILRQPDTAERLASQGFDLVASTPEQFAAFVRAETTKWAEAVRKSGARID